MLEVVTRRHEAAPEQDERENGKEPEAGEGTFWVKTFNLLTHTSVSSIQGSGSSWQKAQVV